MEHGYPVGPFVAVALLASGLAACGGGGGGTDGGGDGNGGGIVTVSATVTFDRPSYTAGNALSFSNLQRLPARGATVEILRASDQSVLTTTTTNGTSGDYSATVTSVPIIVRVKAQLVKTGTGSYDFEVRNNTAS